MVDGWKTCNTCGQSKPLGEFYRSAGMRDGHRNDCKACNLAAKAARYAADPERAIARVREWQRANPEKVLEYRRRRNATDDVKRQNRDGHLRRKFGISLDEYERLLDEQDGRCAICRCAPRKGSSLHVDHEHDSGHVRALLCFDCNAGLGKFRDDRDLVIEALLYLDVHDPEAQAEVVRARERAHALIG